MVTGSIRIVVGASTKKVSKVVVSAQPCEGKTTVRKVKNLEVEEGDRMSGTRNGEFGIEKEIGGALFKLEARFTTSSKASGDVFVGDDSCGLGVNHEFTAKKVVD